MSRNGTARLNPRRDANEPALKAYVEAMGYVVMQVSGKGLPDWVLMGAGFSERKWLVDVKTRTGYFKPAQIAQWTAWESKGINVYVVRTRGDVDALLRGELPPWSPEDAARARPHKPHIPGVSKALKHGDLCQMNHCLTSKAKGSMLCTKHGPTKTQQGWAGKGQTKACGCLRSIGRCEHSGPYDPRREEKACAATQKRYASLGAPAVAAETFAPAPLRCGCTIEVECAECSKVSG